MIFRGGIESSGGGELCGVFSIARLARGALLACSQLSAFVSRGRKLLERALVRTQAVSQDEVTSQFAELM